MDNFNRFLFQQQELQSRSNQMSYSQQTVHHHQEVLNDPQNPYSPTKVTTTTITIHHSTFANSNGGNGATVGGHPLLPIPPQQGPYDDPMDTSCDE